MYRRTGESERKRKNCLKFYSAEDKRQHKSYVYEEQQRNGKVKHEKQDIRMEQTVKKIIMYKF